MERLVNKKDIQSPLKELLLALPQSFGGIEIVDKMITQINDDLLKEALVELKDLYGRLEMKDIFSFDLAMTPNMKYYTGIIIKGYSPYSASPIINGGRYDKLILDLVMI